MFKDQWEWAYKEAKESIQKQIELDINKLIKFITKHNMYVSINDTSNGLIAIICKANHSFVRDFGIIRDRYDFSNIYTGDFCQNNRDSIQALENSTENYYKYLKIWKKGFDHWWKFYKKIVINMVLIMDYICNQCLLPPSHVKFFLVGGSDFNTHIIIDDPEYGHRDLNFRALTLSKGGFDVDNSLDQAFYNMIIYSGKNITGFLDSEEDGGTILDSNGLIRNIDEVMNLYWLALS